MITGSTINMRIGNKIRLLEAKGIIICRIRMIISLTSMPLVMILQPLLPHQEELKFIVQITMVISKTG